MLTKLEINIESCSAFNTSLEDLASFNILAKSEDEIEVLVFDQIGFQDFYDLLLIDKLFEYFNVD